MTRTLAAIEWDALRSRVLKEMERASFGTHTVAMAPARDETRDAVHLRWFVPSDDVIFFHTVPSASLRMDPVLVVDVAWYNVVKQMRGGK
jgi:hypothetical protein